MGWVGPASPPPYLGVHAKLGGVGQDISPHPAFTHAVQAHGLDGGPRKRDRDVRGQGLRPAQRAIGDDHAGACLRGRERHRSPRAAAAQHHHGAPRQRRTSRRGVSGSGRVSVPGAGLRGIRRRRRDIGARQARRQPPLDSSHGRPSVGVPRPAGAAHGAAALKHQRVGRADALRQRVRLVRGLQCRLLLSGRGRGQGG